MSTFYICVIIIMIQASACGKLGIQFKNKAFYSQLLNYMFYK